MSKAFKNIKQFSNNFWCVLIISNVVGIADYHDSKTLISSDDRPILLSSSVEAVFFPQNETEGILVYFLQIYGNFLSKMQVSDR